MIEVMSFWGHREKYPELYVTEEENIKFNYNNKGKTMTNDTLSAQMAEALAIADAERRVEESKHNDSLGEALLGPEGETTTFVQEETTEEQPALQV